MLGSKVRVRVRVRVRIRVRTHLQRGQSGSTILRAKQPIPTRCKTTYSSNLCSFGLSLKTKTEGKNQEKSIGRPKTRQDRQDKKKVKTKQMQGEDKTNSTRQARTRKD